MGLKNFVIKTVLKTLVSNYFNNLKVLGYKLDITDDDKCYIVNARLPKDSINELVEKYIKKGEK